MHENPQPSKAASAAGASTGAGKPFRRTASRTRQVIEFAATLLAGSALMYVTLRIVDIQAVGDALRKIGYGAALLAAMMALTQVFICAWRWQIVSRETESPLRLRDATLGYFEATFVNAFLPTLIASDGVRVLRAISSGANAMAAFIGVVMDRLVALCGLAIAAATGVVLLPDAADNPWLLAAIVGILPAFLIGVIVLDILSKVFSQLSKWRIVRPFLELASYLRRLRQMPRLTLTVLTISIVGHMACAAAFFFLGSQLGLGVSYWSMFALSAPILVYSAVPISIGGWGIREAVSAALFTLVGVAPASAVALSIAFGLLMSAVGIFCGGVALLISLKRKAVHWRRQTAQ